MYFWIGQSNMHYWIWECVLDCSIRYGNLHIGLGNQVCKVTY